MRNIHTDVEAIHGASGVSPWNQVTDDTVLSSEVLAILASDPDAMSAAERDGFEFTGFDLLDSEINTLDLEIGSYAVKGEAAWSDKSGTQTPSVVDSYTELHNQSGVDQFDSIDVTVYSPETVNTGSRFNEEAYDRKVKITERKRTFHDIEFVLDTHGNVRSKLTADRKGNAQSKLDMRAEALELIEAARLKKIARIQAKFGK